MKWFLAPLAGAALGSMVALSALSASLNSDIDETRQRVERINAGLTDLLKSVREVNDDTDEILRLLMIIDCRLVRPSVDCEDST